MIGFPQVYSNSASGRINKTMPLDFDFLKKEDSQVVLLFFGYVNCGDVCPPALNELSRIYEQLNKNQSKVYFINVLDSADEKSVMPYAKSFHKEFKGIYVDTLTMRKISKKLNLAIAKLNEREVSHSGHLYVLEKDSLNKEYTLKYIYTTRPFHEKEIVKDIKTLIQKKNIK